MKKLLSILIAVICVTNLYSQDLGLTIPDLDNSEKASKILLTKAELTQPNTYVVERKNDNLSKKLASAASSKKAFSSALIFLKLKDGGRTVNELTNVYLSDYTNSGSTASGMEKFVVHFEESKPMQ